MKKDIWILLLCGILSGAIPAAGGGAAPPLRVASLSPALTELICHLGGEKMLVARSRACDRPASVGALPVVGDFGTPELERVVSARPDLLVTDTLQDEAVQTTLEDIGIEVLVLPLRSFADYRGAVAALGRRLGLRKAAEQELARVERTLQQYREAVPAERPRVLFLVWHDPLMVPGRQAFVTEFVALAGGRSISEERDCEYFQCSSEWILQRRPEVIIYPGNMGRRAGFVMPEWWKLLPAVQNGRFFRPEDESLFFRLSPRFPETLRELRRWLHPDDEKKQPGSLEKSRAAA